MIVMVLNDNETYTTLEGCTILHVDPDMVLGYAHRDVDEGIKDFLKGEGVTGIRKVTVFT